MAEEDTGAISHAQYKVPRFNTYCEKHAQENEPCETFTNANGIQGENTRKTLQDLIQRIAPNHAVLSLTPTPAGYLV